MSVATSAESKAAAAFELPDKPSGAWKAPVIALVIVAITVVMCLPGIGIDVDFSAIARNWQNGAGKVLQLLVPDWSFFLARSLRSSRPCRWQSLPPRSVR